MSWRAELRAARQRSGRWLWAVAALGASLSGCEGCGGGAEVGAQKETPRHGGCPPGTKPVEGSVRPAALAGSWYPGDAAELGSSVKAMLAAAPAFDGE